MNLDLLSNDSIRKSIEQIKGITSKIDFLINNAGVMATRKFSLSEGVESQFKGIYLGHWLFTNLLLKEGVVGEGGVVVSAGSLGYQMDDVHFEDINYEVR